MLLQQSPPSVTLSQIPQSLRLVAAELAAAIISLTLSGTMKNSFSTCNHLELEMR